MGAFQKIVARADWILLAVILLALGMGLVAIWSFAPSESHFFQRQAVWVALGLGVFLFFALLDYRIFRNHGGFLVALYLLNVLALAALLFFAPVIRGVSSWFRVLGAGIEPAEPMKLILVLVLAKYFSRRHIEIARLRHLLISAAYTAVPLMLVLFQPDIGAAIILGAIWVAVVLFSGITWRHFAIFLLIAVIFSGLAWTSFLKPYQKARIVSFLDPYRDPTRSGYHAIQAMIAAGSGGLFGKGIGYGSQSHLNFLPEPETDFVFAAFTEETGIVGAFILLAVFGVMFWRMLLAGAEAEDNFSKLYVLGFISLIFAEFGIHVAMNLGLLPITGVGLPLISYGGSSLVVTLAGLGILQSIKINSVAEVE